MKGPEKRLLRYKYSNSCWNGNISCESMLEGKKSFEKKTDNKEIQHPKLKFRNGKSLIYW